MTAPSAVPAGPWQPLLVVEARGGGLGAAPALTVLAVFALASGTATFAFVGAIPWLPKGAPLYALAWHPLVWKVVLLPAAVVVARSAKSRHGRVEFYEDRISISKHEGAVEVHWGDLAAFRDDAQGWVQLVRKGERFASADLTVPTATEEDRVAVLALLDRRGIPREEA